MPRMEPSERKEVLEKIIPRLGMKIDSDAVWKISDLSRGLPSYIHALGLYSVNSAIERKSRRIIASDVDNAIERVLEKSQEIVRDNYAKAVHSNRQDSMYREVLLACALAETNEHGYFTPQSVCEPLTAILDRQTIVPIATFQQHLKKFIEDDRAKILTRTGRERSFQFRFTDPVMQPYVIMKGIQHGLVDATAMNALAKPAQGNLPI